MVLNRENQRIYNETSKLLLEARRLAPSTKNPVSLCKKLAPKYEWLKTKYFAIFRASCYGVIEMRTLKIMLEQKQRMDNNKADIEETSGVIRDVLCKKFNINQEKMAKDIAKEQTEEKKQ